MGGGCLHVPQSCQSCTDAWATSVIYDAPLQPSGVCLHLLSSDQFGHGFQRWNRKKKKNAGPLDATPPSSLFPPWTLGLGMMFVSQGEKRSGANRREQHMECIGAAGKRRMENDKTGCPSSFPLNTGPKSILLPAWDFPQPKFWVNPISCPQDWDVVCQRWQSSAIMGDTVQHF